MRMRFKFGPKLSAPVIRPEVEGELTDPEVGIAIDHFEAGDPGEVHVHLGVSIAAHNPATHSKLLAVHAIAFQPGDSIPGDPQKALQVANPQASVAAAGQTSGVTLPLAVKKVPEGSATIVTVLVFDDEPPASSTPTLPATASTPAAPSPPTTDPTTATDPTATPVPEPTTPDSTPPSETTPATDPASVTPPPTAAS